MLTTATLRPYKIGDAPELVALFRASVHGIAAADYTPEQISAWADAIDDTAFAARCVDKDPWVAELEGRLAGFAILERDGHIDLLYVHPDCRRRGVARALLQHVEALARASGVPRLYTEASITARPAFVASGFRVLSPQTVTVRGQAMTNYRMEKPLP
jgi:putative acetyltransferase